MGSAAASEAATRVDRRMTGLRMVANIECPVLKTEGKSVRRGSRRLLHGARPGTRAPQYLRRHAVLLDSISLMSSVLMPCLCENLHSLQKSGLDTDVN